jgi:hypothetical protein
MAIETGWKAAGTVSDVVRAALDVLKTEFPKGNAWQNWGRYTGDFDHYYHDAASALGSVHHDLVLISPEEATTVMTFDQKTGMASLECVPLTEAALAWRAMNAACEEHNLPTYYPTDRQWDKWSIHGTGGAAFVWSLHSHGTHICTLTHPDAATCVKAMHEYVLSAERTAYWYVWTGEALMPVPVGISSFEADRIASGRPMH